MRFIAYSILAFVLQIWHTQAGCEAAAHYSGWARTDVGKLRFAIVARYGGEVHRHAA